MIAAMARSTPKNPEVAEQFDLLADLLELEGADTFRVVAYRRAGDTIPGTARSLVALAVAGRGQGAAGKRKTEGEEIGPSPRDREMHAPPKTQAAGPARAGLLL